MSGVALRCPKCGTTQSHTGECDACYGGLVRYFCSNHNPGLWLDEPVCKECGGKFGEAPRKRPAPPPPAASPTPPRAPRRPESRRPRVAEPPSTSPRRPPAPEVTSAEPSLPSLKDLLTHLLLKRRERTVFKDEKGPWDEPPPEVRRRRPRAMGCLIKLILVALLLLALAFGVSFLFVAGALQHLL